MDFRRLFRLATGRSTRDQDLAEELDLHLALRAEELVEEGWNPELARVEALRRFGDRQHIQRAVAAIDRERDSAMRRAEWLDALVGDLRHAVRALRRNPGFALGAILTLGLGIGLNTAVFSVFEGVLLRPLPFADPDRLVRVWSTSAGRGLQYFSVSAPDFLDWRSQARSFERLAAFQRQEDFALTGDGGDPERIQGARVSAEVFQILGVRPMLGRPLRADQDAAASQATVLLGFGLWQRRFGGDSGIIGRVLLLNEEPRTIVGVMPRGFFLPGSPTELWMPLGPALSNVDRGNRFLRVLGRLAPGASLKTAQGELDLLARRAEQASAGTNSGWTITMLGLTEAVVGQRFKAAVGITLGAVGLVLLIACANVATMVLGRSAARGRELAVRTALGAGSRRLARLLLTEGLVLGLAGGAIGVLLALGLIRLLHGIGPANVPRLEQVRVNAAVLTLALGLSIGTGVVFGLTPLRRAADPGLSGQLREGGRGTAGGRQRHRTQRLLVVAQMTMAILLLSGAGLLLQSLVRLQRVELGFEPDRILSLDIALGPGKYADRGRVATFYEGLMDRLRAIPEVREAAAVSSIPLGGVNPGVSFAVLGRPLPEAGSAPDADYRTTTPGYFHLMRIPLLRGRDFTEADDSTAEPVVIVSAGMARRYWPGANPLGDRIRLGDIRRGPVVTVIGVVGDVRYLSLESPEVRSMMYFPLRRSGERALSVLLATTGAPSRVADAARRAVFALDPRQPVSGVRTLAGVVDDALAQPRFNLVVLAGFAIAALLLAAVGLYGIMAYSVTQRTRELGVRMALGADRSRVVRMIAGEAAGLVAFGVGLGLSGALLLNRALSSLLFGVRPDNPAALAAASLLLAGVALAGALVPARRAAAVDPMTTLRAD